MVRLFFSSTAGNVFAASGSFLSIIIEAPALRFTGKHHVWLIEVLLTEKGPKLFLRKQGPSYSLWNSNWFLFFQLLVSGIVPSITRF